MKIKELKRMNRAELLELLIAQMEENERLEARLNEAEAQLQNRQLVMDHAGSIAEAALALNGVFEAAEAAAQQYLESVRNQEEVCRRMEEAAQRKSKAMIAEADAYWDSISKRVHSLLQEDEKLRSSLLTGEGEGSV